MTGTELRARDRCGEAGGSGVAFISAGLAHDVGHELATVAYLAAVVRSDPALGRDNRRRLELIEQEVARVQELVAVGSHTAPEEVALNPLVADLVEPLALAAPTAVTAALGPEIRLTVDRHALWRLLGNLVGNAVRAAGPSGRVRVAVVADPVPGIEVHDDGPGPCTGPPGSHGLGLRTSRQLARRCGAVLSLRPGPQGGTVARVRFEPRPSATAPPTRSAPPAALHGGRG